VNETKLLLKLQNENAALAAENEKLSEENKRLYQALTKKGASWLWYPEFAVQVSTAASFEPKDGRSWESGTKVNGYLETGRPVEDLVSDLEACGAVFSSPAAVPGGADPRFAALRILRQQQSTPAGDCRSDAR
jgi:hypothetical protein